MSGGIAIGVGCRHGCSADLIEALVRQALERAPKTEPLGLFTVSDKAGEAGLTEAARRLRLDLVFLTRDALRDKAAYVETPSIRTHRLFGVPAVAETAALAGAGAGSILIVPRIANAGATCAIARTPDHQS